MQILRANPHSDLPACEAAPWPRQRQAVFADHQRVRLVDRRVEEIHRGRPDEAADKHAARRP
jgi:hypothetical protein